MARILSVSYDETLLRTRELLLKSAGHKTTSALQHKEAMEKCRQTGYELVIIGHSIAKADKLEIIACFRKNNPRAIVIALTRGGESRLREVDHYINPGDPEELLRAIGRVLKPTSERRRLKRPTEP